MVQLKHKHVMLTGASRGIGRALALGLAPDGVRLSFCGRDPELLEQVARKATELGAGGTHREVFDLSDPEATVGFYHRTREVMGPPDVLINNAGFNSRKAEIVEVTTEEFDAQVAVNLRAPFLLLREAARDMRERGAGHIVNILSTVCHFSNERMGIYTATKWGLDGLTRVLRKELRPHGVRVSSVYPGGTDTGFRDHPRPDYTDPASVAGLITFLLKTPEDLVVHDVTFRPMVESNF